MNIKVKLILLFAVTMFFVFCTKEGYTISGSVKEVKDGTKIFMRAPGRDYRTSKIIDSATIKNGKFLFEGIASEPSEQFLEIKKGTGIIFYFILENGSISIELDKKSPEKSKCFGTYNNDERTKVRIEDEKIIQPLIDFDAKNQSILEKAKVSKGTGTAAIKNMLDQRQTIEEKCQSLMDEMRIEYIKTHPKSYFSLVVLRSMMQSFKINTDDAVVLFSGLDKSIRNTKTGKIVGEEIQAAIVYEITK